VRVVAIILVVLAVFTAIWLGKKNFNQFFFYGNEMEETVCEMVKNEHLTAEGRRICRS
jgi:hypothetical protein